MSNHPGAAGVAEADHDEDHPHKTTLDRLIYMGNQIGWFFKSQPEKTIVPGILDHIQHFWDPRMRSEIFRHIDETGGTGIEPYVLDALIQLKLASEAKKAARPDEQTKVETGQQRAGEAPKDVTEEGRG
ncbi:formate dehydrogenase subunit delta [Methylopila sp. M107]|uniref:formate dehydrogenase subunit delta n=1 Tax=Methylopila sp. M107 TaxID=1101190 RepID=UPI000368203E